MATLSTVGRGTHRYEVVPDWATGAGSRRPGGVITGLTTGNGNHVYLCRRKPPAILVYDALGHFVDEWGIGELSNPHGISADGDGLWVADTDDHTIRRFSYTGSLVTVLGTCGTPGEPAEPFNRPTKAVVGPSGRLFVTDGYGNRRVHCFSSDGTLLHSWGQEGSGPGQFSLPHGLAVDAHGRVIVADRENSRLEIFADDGRYLSEFSGRMWPGVLWPNDVCVDASGAVYVAEAGHRVSIWEPDNGRDTSPIFAPACEWRLVARWGDFGDAPGQFLDCPHAIAVDSVGDVYVAEVPFHENRIHKFRRIPELT